MPKEYWDMKQFKGKRSTGIIKYKSGKIQWVYMIIIIFAPRPLTVISKF